MDNFEEINLYNLNTKLKSYRIINLYKCRNNDTQLSHFNMYFNELKPENKGHWSKKNYLKYLKVTYNYFNELENYNLFLALKEKLYSRFLEQQYFLKTEEKDRFVSTRKPHVLIIDLYNTQP
ncbi:2644_t:CDS:1 [Gigaspora margarita]|uniref:2644_t:CDS:1 n=1 Tax=Gigaspora margarita TaxID=4874 RepID=A0ABN7V2A5_GIGMA|nr:2644_t:CDS:1 [Gigaspora margarita]